MTSSCGTHCWIAIYARWKWQKVLFPSIHHCCLCWVCCLVRCWMLQDMDDMEANCVFHVNVGTFDQLEQGTICVFTIIKMWICMLTTKHDFIFSVSLMHDPGELLRETSPDVPPLDECLAFFWNSRDFGCREPIFMPQNKQTTFDRLTALPGMVGKPSNLSPYVGGFVLSRMCKLDVTYSILTWS